MLFNYTMALQITNHFYLKAFKKLHKVLRLTVFTLTHQHYHFIAYVCTFTRVVVLVGYLMQLQLLKLLIGISGVGRVSGAQINSHDYPTLAFQCVLTRTVS